MNDVVKVWLPKLLCTLHNVAVVNAATIQDLAPCFQRNVTLVPLLGLAALCAPTASSLETR